MDSKHLWPDIYDTVNKNNWWLYDSQGGHVNYWPNTWMVNITATEQATGANWPDYFSNYINQKIISTGLWDGIFFDNSFDDVSWVGNGQIDINRDGQADNSDSLNGQWRAAMNKIFTQSRNLMGAEKIFIANSSSYYNQYLNGRLYEHFPDFSNGWTAGTNEYLTKKNGYAPATFIINRKGNNSGDYTSLRYGLASALLGDGLYSFDGGAETHSQIWWFDEYNTWLGQPVAAIKNLRTGGTGIKEGVWQRDFANGIVVVNSTDKNETIDLGAEYERIHGDQDKATNDGRIIASLELPPRDGALLLRPIEKIISQTYTNASFVRVFNSVGQSIRNGFFAYNSSFHGNANILSADIDHDGQTENIVAEGKKITIYDSSNKPRQSFLPYGDNYSGNINFAIGDLDKNGFDEIVTGAAKGGPHIRIFNYQGKLVNPGFFAFDKKSKGGVTVAIGDINGDGRKEIITGAGANILPQIRIFDAKGKLLNTFLVYEKGFKGGVNVATGDIDGDRKDEIITGKGPSGEPLVKVFSGQGKTLNFGFYAFDRTSRGGVRVIAYDLDGNGRAEILANRTNVFTTAIINNQ